MRAWLLRFKWKFDTVVGHYFAMFVMHEASGLLQVRPQNAKKEEGSFVISFQPYLIKSKIVETKDCPSFVSSSAGPILAETEKP